MLYCNDQNSTIGWRKTNVNRHWCIPIAVELFAKKFIACSNRCRVVCYIKLATPFLCVRCETVFSFKGLRSVMQGRQEGESEWLPEPGWCPAAARERSLRNAHGIEKALQKT